MYTFKSLPKVASASGPGVLTSLADIQDWSVFSSVGVIRIMAKVSTSVVSTDPVQLQFVRRPTPGSATGELVLGTLFIPGGSLAGKTFYKDLSGDNEVQAGQEVIARVFLAADGGGAAGAVIAEFISVEDPEVPLNESNLVASL
jgi:hypothetical protein